MGLNLHYSEPIWRRRCFPKDLSFLSLPHKYLGKERVRKRQVNRPSIISLGWWSVVNLSFSFPSCFETTDNRSNFFQLMIAAVVQVSKLRQLERRVTTKGWLERKERIQPTVVTNRSSNSFSFSRKNRLLSAKVINQLNPWKKRLMTADLFFMMKNNVSGKWFFLFLFWIGNY